MPKSQTKSSASSATRKKHARKAAGGAEQALPLPKEKKSKDKSGKGKGKKDKEPRVKMYIRPSKPAPVRPDPLDSLGLAKALPPDLLVVLRRLSKKDAVTKRKAIEDLRDDWVESILRGEDAREGGMRESALVAAMPVWLHHLPTLLLHASRQIRATSASLHYSLLRIESLRLYTRNFVEETGESSQVELVIGSWALSAHDVDRQASSSARRVWQLVFPSPSSSSSLALAPVLVTPLLHFAHNTVLDPLALYHELNPVQPDFVSPPLPLTQARGKGDTGAKRGTPPPPTRPIQNDEDSTPRKVEDEEESEDDRKARLRIGALGIFKWIIEQPSVAFGSLLNILQSPLIWTSLYHGLTAPFLPKNSDWPAIHLGANQPAVRRSAWSMLLSLLKSRKDDVDTLVPILSSAVLRSAWVEPDPLVRGVMWEPLLVFLTQKSRAWEIDLDNQRTRLYTATRLDVPDDGDDESESSDADEDENRPSEEKQASRGGSKLNEDSLHSQAFAEFLRFLQLGCSGSPVQGYPTVVVILSTVPSSILGNRTEDWLDVLTSFWAALDGRALSSLDRSASGAAFLSALLECTVFLVKRAMAFSKVEEIDDANNLDNLLQKTPSEQLGRAWEEIVSGNLRVENDVAGKAIARTLGSLENINQAFFDEAWIPISSSLSIPAQQGSDSLHAFSSRITLLKSVNNYVKVESNTALAIQSSVRQITSDLLHRCTENLAAFSTSTQFSRVDPNSSSAVLNLLKDMVDEFGSLIFSDADLSKRTDDLLQLNAPSILLSTGGPVLLLSYFSSQPSQSTSSALWHVVLRILNSMPEAQDSALPVLLEGAGTGKLPPYLHPGEDDLSGLLGRMVASLFESEPDSTKMDLAKRLLENPGYFLSRHMSLSLIHTLLYGFREKSRLLICPQLSSVPQTFSDNGLLAVAAPLELILNTLKAHPSMLQATDVREFLPDIFIFAFVLAKADGVVGKGEESFRLARQIWELSLQNYQPEDAISLRVDIKKVLRELISDVDCQASPLLILESFSENFLGSSDDILRDFFPSEDSLADMLQELPSYPLHPAIAVVDPLVPPLSLWAENGTSAPRVTYDSDGYSEYARVVSALLDVASRDRHLARNSIWLLRHFLVLESSASDFRLFSAESTHFFRKNVSDASLEGIIERVKTLTAFLLSDVGEESWHRSVVNSSFQPGSSSNGSSPNGPVADFILLLLHESRQRDTAQTARILYTTMKHVLSGADKADAEQWMTLGRRLERQAPQASLAIVLSITESGLEPPSLDRYRNEQASGILGIPSSKANTEGLALLRRLAVSAPDPESDVIFLPQTRAVNFMKTCQAWLSSDEDIAEDVESEMTGVFVHLAPILQNVPGSHWELIFDLIENNLENISSLENSNLPVLSRTLKLLLTIQDLSKTNKSLRTDWKEHELAILKLVRDLVQNASLKDTFASINGSGMLSTEGARPPVSVPRQVCWEMAFSIIRDLPPSLVDHDTISNMAHLVRDPSPELAKMAYGLLQDAAAKRTEYLVVEAGVDNSEEAKFELPVELLQILQDFLPADDVQNDLPHNVFSYLLGWMLVFDLFGGASLRVKMGYASQLRDMGLISTSFLPNVLGLLNVYDGRGKSFSLEYWKVDEYYVQLYDVDSELSPKLLAAHLFYRALLNVPSLIASWWGECKDRQLSNAVATFTTKYFSPVLIAAELGHVKDPAGAEELAGENWSIKVSTGSGEVTASYMVDDQEMDIAVRLPPDYPIHSIEVREVHRLGVDEKKWRGWLLAVQQVITSQNGRIVDGLSMFKKNVTHHFENQTECAICYSIISVTELTLPKKRCKTCKNRFHAGCLFKWFNTSHTSSCPLCRSDFI